MGSLGVSREASLSTVAIALGLLGHQWRTGSGCGTAVGLIETVGEEPHGTQHHDCKRAPDCEALVQHFLRFGWFGLLVEGSTTGLSAVGW